MKEIIIDGKIYDLVERTATKSKLDIMKEKYESRTCESCKYLDRDTGKSYSTCNNLDINIGADTEKEFYCAYWEGK